MGLTFDRIPHLRAGMRMDTVKYTIIGVTRVFVGEESPPAQFSPVHHSMSRPTTIKDAA